MPHGKLLHGMFPFEVKISVLQLRESSLYDGNGEQVADEEHIVGRIIATLAHPFLTMTGNETFAFQTGVSRHNKTLILNVCHTDYHEGDKTDWRTEHTMRYTVRREGDDIVLRPLMRDEIGRNGIVLWRGASHAEAVIRAWDELLSENQQFR